MTDEIKAELKRILDKYADQLPEEEQIDLSRYIERRMQHLTEEEQLTLLLTVEDKIQNRIREINEESKIRKKRFTVIVMEFYAWLIAGFLSSFVFWGAEFGDNYSRLIYIALFLLIPFIFYLLFSKAPFTYLRDRLINKPKDYDFISASLSGPELNVKVQALILHCIQESKANTERLFSQSRTYLLLGCVIAISGVCVFFFLNDPDSVKDLYEYLLGNNNNPLNILIIKLLENLPRFGVLFFIEYIAFFFLKQYRILMEEYRYYESIKRERQDLLVAYLSIKELEDKKEALDQFLNYMDKHSAVVPQITGTHKLKTEKMVYEDLDLLAKIIPLIQAVKPNEKAKGD